ncbi:hypothetical protein G6F24_018736 [Rhizopus arrhizus]|nr:hypothetical protein G6F24_018736 [Rhizopus arrhizus]
MPDGQPVRGQCRRRAEVHPGLRADVRLWRTQGHVDGASGPRVEGEGLGRTRRFSCQRPRVRALSQRQRRGLGLRAALEAAALR